MRAKAILRLKPRSEKHLEIIYEALIPEIEKPAATRSKASIKKNGKMLVLKVEGKDTVALRVALNAYLRWVSALSDVFSILEPHLSCKE